MKIKGSFPQILQVLIRFFGYLHVTVVSSSLWLLHHLASSSLWLLHHFDFLITLASWSLTFTLRLRYVCTCPPLVLLFMVKNTTRYMQILKLINLYTLAVRWQRFGQNSVELAVRDMTITLSSARTVKPRTHVHVLRLSISPMMKILNFNRRQRQYRHTITGHYTHHTGRPTKNGPNKAVWPHAARLSQPQAQTRSTRPLSIFISATMTLWMV